MKSILLIISVMISIISFAQEKYRIPVNLYSEMYSKTGSSLLSRVMAIESTLNDNNSMLKSPQATTLKQPNLEALKETYNSLGSRQKKWVDEKLCLKCYNKEWEYQNELLSKIVLKENQRLDSLVLVRQEAIRQNALREDSIMKARESQNKTSQNPYDNIRMNSLRKEDNSYVLPFIGLDFNFSGTHFENYLQETMKLNSGSVSADATTFKHKFSSKINPDKNYLVVNYTMKTQEGIIGYVGSNPSLITSVDIIGTSDLIIKLYASYWDTRFKYVGDRANRMIVENNYWGDLITLHHLPNNQLKITIRKGNTFNYEKDFGIHKRIL